MSIRLLTSTAFSSISPTGFYHFIRKVDSFILICKFLTQATQLRSGILCRGCLASVKRSSNLPLIIELRSTINYEVSKKKRASNLRVRNTGTHDFVQRDNEFNA